MNFLLLPLCGVVQKCHSCNFLLLVSIQKGKEVSVLPVVMPPENYLENNSF